MTRSTDGESRERVCVGAIAGAHGVRGEVKVKCFTEDPKDVGAYGALETEDGTKRFNVRVVREAKDGVVARIKGVGDRDSAQALKGTRLYVDRDRLPPPEEESWYYADLIGLRVETPDGSELGTILAVQDYGAGDLLELAPEDGGATILLPFTRDVVPVVDIAAGRLVADPPEGLIGETETDDDRDGS